MKKSPDTRHKNKNKNQLKEKTVKELPLFTAVDIPRPLFSHTDSKNRGRLQQAGVNKETSLTSTQKTENKQNKGNRTQR